MRRFLAYVSTFSVVHFVVAMAFAILTFGIDFDQLRSRSIVSRTAGHVNDFLWYPHDAIVRALPGQLLARPGVIPAVLIVASIVWGCAAYLSIRGACSLRRRPHRPPPSSTSPIDAEGPS